LSNGTTGGRVGTFTYRPAAPGTVPSVSAAYVWCYLYWYGWRRGKTNHYSSVAYTQAAW